MILSAAPAGAKPDTLGYAMKRSDLSLTGTVFHLAEGLKKPWAMRRELLTPCCTTRWDELPLEK